MSNFWVKLLAIALAVVVLVLAVAWYDGGRETPRLIEQEVDLAHFDLAETGA